MLAIEKRLREIITKTKGKKILVYGGGIWGIRIQRLLLSLGREIDGFIDNNKACVLEGYPVISIEDVQKRKLGDCVIIIGSGRSNVIKKMKEDLLKESLQEEVDFFYRFLNWNINCNWTQRIF